MAMPLMKLGSIVRSFTCNQHNTCFRKPQENLRKWSSGSAPPNVTKSGIKQGREKLRSYVVQRYMQYVQNYTNVLENRFPKAMKMYRVFSIGIKDFISDLRLFMMLRTKVKRSKSLTCLNRQELELFHKMPIDMWRIAPVLIISAIPFGNYVIFPLAFMKPRALLCSHFWSIQQKAEFMTLDLIDRLQYNKPVFRNIQSKLDAIPNDNPLKEKWASIIAMIGSGVHPTVNDILYCKDLFLTSPYSLDKMTYNHCGNLCKMHGMYKGILRRNKLKYRAHILLEMDKAILKEGGVEYLSTEALKYACHIRGLYGSLLTNQEMMTWLNDWLKISENVDRRSYSLILHCPILLAYNNPQNWMLIY